MPTAERTPDFIDRIDAWLPQTQCTRCGYPRCRDYAHALARGEADFDRCPPGGDATIAGLAQLLGAAVKPLDPAVGATSARARALIDEARCIGCRKCLDACPVDAIVGANKLMHTVIADHCTGCELCLPPCPVDCIDMIPVPARHGDSPWPEYAMGETVRWRELTERRFARRAQRPARPRESHPVYAAEPPLTTKSSSEIKMEIAAAVARVQGKRARNTGRK
jgi:electron transport complex protein RnfB